MLAINKKVNDAAQAELDRQDQMRDMLIRRYDKFVGASREIYEQEKKKPMKVSTQRTLAQCLDNTRKLLQHGRQMDNTYSSDISFTNYAFDVVSAIIPSLIAEEIVSLQPMDRRTGQIFFMNFLIDKTKGSLTAGDNLFNAKTGWNRQSSYSTGVINSEVLFAGDGSSTTAVGTLDYHYLVASTTVTFTTNEGTPQVATGTVGATTTSLTGDFTGTITNATGAYTLAGFTAFASNKNMFGTYTVDQEKDTNAIGKIKIDLASETVTATTRKLSADWLLDAAYDLQQAHGRDAQKELLVALIGEIKAELDREVILALYAGATGTPVTWDKTPPSTAVPYIWHKKTIIDTFIEASSNIFEATNRATGNFIVCSTSVANVVDSLDEMNSNSLVDMDIAGAYFLGTLKNRWKIYVSPDMPTDKFVVGYIGDSYLTSGYVLSFYNPLISLAPYTTSDFVTHTGLGSSSAQHLINGKMYVVGTMTES